MDAPLNLRTSPEAVALTFDDGPSRWTDRVLDELGEHGATATFFVTPNGSDFAETVARIDAAGHGIGYHCSTHVRHSERSRPQVETEAGRDVELLREMGFEVSAWRPPWGDLAPWTRAIAAELGLGVWLWSDDSHDWDGRVSAAMLHDLGVSLSPGSVVLMHDGIGPGARRDDPEQTIALIGPLVALARHQGLEPGLLRSREAAVRA